MVQLGVPINYHNCAISHDNYDHSLRAAAEGPALLKVPHRGHLAVAEQGVRHAVHRAAEGLQGAARTVRLCERAVCVEGPVAPLLHRQLAAQQIPHLHDQAQRGLDRQIHR